MTQIIDKPITQGQLTKKITVRGMRVKKYTIREKINQIVGTFREGKPYFVLYGLRMKCSLFYIAQGLIGLFTLGIRMPVFTSVISPKIAKQSSIVNKLKTNKMKSYSGEVHSDDDFDDMYKVKK